MATKPDASAAAVEKTLLALLAKLEPLLVERDALKITGDLRRARQAAARIRELLAQLKSDDQVAALGGALAISYEAGYLEANRTAGVSPAAGVSQALDRNEMLALGRVAADPLAAALATAKSALPYIAPRMDEEKRKQVAELVLEAKARGLSWEKTARLIEKEMPDLGRVLEGKLERGAVVTFAGGYQLPVQTYSRILARTTSVWAANSGRKGFCEDAGITTVMVPKLPGGRVCDLCGDLENKVYALTAEAAAEFDVPLLADTPGGGPPWHPQCRHTLSPWSITRQKDLTS